MDKFDELFVQRGLSMERLWSFEKIVAAGGSLISAARGDPERAAFYARQKAALEKYFGISLTCREGQNTKLTPEGQRLGGAIRQCFLRLLDLKSEGAHRPRQFSIGAGESLLHWLVIPRLAQLQANREDFSFSLHNMQNADIIAGLNDLSLDFGLVRPQEAKQPLARVLLGTRTYALYVPAELLSGLESARNDPKKLLKSLPLAAQSRQTSFQREFERAAAKAKAPLNVRLYCETVPALVRAVRTKKYAGVLHSFAAEELQDKQFQQLEVPFLKEKGREIALVWNPRLIEMRGESAEKLKSLLSGALRLSVPSTP